MSRGRHRLRASLTSAGALLVVYAALSVPDCEQAPSTQGARPAFRWDRDAFWDAQRQRFELARQRDCTVQAPTIEQRTQSIHALLSSIAARPPAPAAAPYRELEAAIFDLAPLVAACPVHLPGFAAAVQRARAVVKKASTDWDMSNATARAQLYRVIYGGRAALEEAMLQASSDAVPTLVRGTDEPSPTPSVELHGVRIHSGDLLVSRGGAPTSALIARANDFPGNFSHVALVHVDRTGHAVVVEAHIEIGMAVSSAERYLQDKKLRILVLRPRADHPLLRANPMLPHEAATHALDRARREHVPYDFAMDFEDPSKLFCSEVASSAYRTRGLELWMGISHISSPVLRAWLAGFGVEHFTTQAPSDLEFDPSLRVVAEWRDPEVLWDDHLDSAVIDGMVEHANGPRALDYPRRLLAPIRLLKAYSAAKNLLGAVGPIPEGMSATSALRNRAFTERHRALKTELVERAAAYRRQRGYRPPYWDLVAMTEQPVEAGQGF